MRCTYTTVSWYDVIKKGNYYFVEIGKDERSWKFSFVAGNGRWYSSNICKFE